MRIEGQAMKYFGIACLVLAAVLAYLGYDVYRHYSSKSVTIGRVELFKVKTPSSVTYYFISSALAAVAGIICLVKSKAGHRERK